MGTSASSRGTSAGNQLIPSWIDDLYPIGSSDSESTQGETEEQQPDTTPTETPTSNPTPTSADPITVGSLRSARRAIGSFARSGLKDDLRAAVAHHARNGLGGSKSATKRFQPVAHVAGRMFDALQSARAQESAPSWLTVDLTAIGRAPTMTALEQIAKEICPLNGTQDSEILQRGVAEALSILLEVYPDAELGNLSDVEMVFLFQQFLALEIDHRIQLDLGQNLMKHAPSAAIAAERQNEVREYVASEVETVFKSVATTELLNKSALTTQVSNIIKRVIEIFEEYFQE